MSKQDSSLHTPKINLRPNLDEAGHILNLLDQDAINFCFQAFD